MAEFNQCSQLLDQDKLEEVRNYIDDYTKNGRDGFQLILDMQNTLQTELFKRLPQNGNKSPTMYPNEATCGEMVEVMRSQKDSIDDEFRELLTSFGGMSNGEKQASAVWKKWKSDYQSKQNTKFIDLSPEDQLEAKFEMVDIMHFVAVMINAMGISSQELTELYILKNLENMRRYQTNY